MELDELIVNVRSGVYRIRNLNTHSVYIGSSRNLIARFRAHRVALRRGVHHSAYLQRSWNIHGEKAFRFEVLEACGWDRDVLLAREQYHFDNLSPDYNTLTVAGSPVGMRHSVETKLKISRSNTGKNTGKVRSAATRALISKAARNISSETRAKMAAAKLGRPVPEDTRRKMSDARMGYQTHPSSVEKTKKQKAANRAARLASSAPLNTADVRVNRKLRRLSEDVVRYIRSSVLTDKEISAELGTCSATTVGRIRRYQIYRDV